jgi:hypothetical protein
MIVRGMRGTDLCFMETNGEGQRSLRPLIVEFRTDILG